MTKFKVYLRGWTDLSVNNSEKRANSSEQVSLSKLPHPSDILNRKGNSNSIVGQTYWRAYQEEEEGSITIWYWTTQDQVLRRRTWSHHDYRSLTFHAFCPSVCLSVCPSVSQSLHPFVFTRFVGHISCHRNLKFLTYVPYTWRLQSYIFVAQNNVLYAKIGRKRPKYLPCKKVKRNLNKKQPIIGFEFSQYTNFHKMYWKTRTR